MTQEEIKEYNKRCAECLGYVNTTPTDKDFNIHENNKGKMIETNFTNVFIKNWNWIMKVVEKIETTEILLDEKYKKGFLKNSTHGNVIFSITYDNREEFKGWLSSVSIELEHPYIYDSLNYEISRFKTKKEAVVHAINQFLIWYNENNK